MKAVFTSQPLENLWRANKVVKHRHKELLPPFMWSERATIATTKELQNTSSLWSFARIASCLSLASSTTRRTCFNKSCRKEIEFAGQFLCPLSLLVFAVLFGKVQDSAKRPVPGCVNATGRWGQQKQEQSSQSLPSHSMDEAHRKWQGYQEWLC